MRFSMRGHSNSDQDPDINLIPMIDLFLVIIIFLMQTTTYDRFSELQITLPQGGQTIEEPAKTKSREIFVGINSTGLYKIDGEKLQPGTSVDKLVEAIRASIQKRGQPAEKLMIVINADAQTTHQSVVNTMEAANQAGISNITFATQPAAKEKTQKDE